MLKGQKPTSHSCSLPIVKTSSRQVPTRTRSKVSYSSRGRRNSNANQKSQPPKPGRPHSNSNFRDEFYVDPRDTPKYKEKMSDNPQKGGAVYEDPTLFGLKYGTDSGRSYSNNFRPKWAIDLSESLNNTPTDLADPELNFPQFDPNATAPRIHPEFKVKMEYSPQVNLPFLQSSKIKYLPTKAQKPNVAFLFSYRGTGYQGLQIQFQGNAINTSLKTIEYDMLQAFNAAGYISESNANDPNKIKWSRAARTDKGVHAACNTLSAKLQIPYVEQVPEAMVLKKKALKYASHRYPVLFPAFCKKVTQLLNEFDQQSTTLDLIEGDNFDGAVKFIDGLQEIDPVTKKHIHPPLPTNKDMIPRLLTQNADELANLLVDHVQVNLYGDLTISPSLEYTLKRFKIIGDDSAENSVKKLLQAVQTQAEAEGCVVHQFTPWEKQIFHLIAQHDREWVEADVDDDDVKNDQVEGSKEDDTMIPTETAASTKTDEKGNKMSKRQRSLAERRSEHSRGPLKVQYLQYAKQYGWDEGFVQEFMNPDYFSDCIIGKIRQYLPKQFHLTRAVKVSGGFDPKLQASTRTYEYIIPSFAFMPISAYPDGVYADMLKSYESDEKLQVQSERAFLKELQSAKNEAKTDLEAADAGIEESCGSGDGKLNSNGKRNRGKKEKEKEDDDDDDMEEGEDVPNATDLSNLVPQPPKELIQYRLSPQNLIDLQYTLSHYIGTRSHHNFTQGKNYNDASARRHIRSFKPIGVFTIDGVEFVHLCVHGDSFLLHQIRKMVGFSLYMMRGSFDDVLQVAEIEKENAPATNDKKKDQHQAPKNTVAGAKDGDDAETAMAGMGDEIVPATANKKFQPFIRSSEEYTAALAVAQSLAKDGEVVNEATFKPTAHLVKVCDAAFPLVFSQKRFNIHPAPALGLLLDHVHYDHHDTRLAKEIPQSIKRGLSHVRETLHASFVRALPLLSQIKNKEIYPEIAVQELATSSAWRFLHQINALTFTTTQLDDTGKPIHRHRSLKNEHIIQANKKFKTLGIVDVHGDQSVVGDLQYVQLASSTAAIPRSESNQ